MSHGHDRPFSANVRIACAVLSMILPACGSGDNTATAPDITTPVMFNTPEADRILAALQVFPKDNPWNEDISGLPVLENSDAMIALIGADKPLAYNLDMSFILVPGDQPKVPLRINLYPDESDPGPYPIPDNAPIEN